MVNIAHHCRDGTLDAEVALVVASRETIALEKARELGINAHVRTGQLGPHELDELVDAHRIDWIVLAGYLKKLPITPRVAGRVVNIHPGLLPGDGTPGPFGGPGMHGAAVHRAVIAAFERGEVTESGCTVHLCDAEYDSGPVVLTRSCPVMPGDTPEALAERVFGLELEAYPAALQRLVAGERTNT